MLAVFENLGGIALDRSGTLYISDSVAIHRVSGGIISAIAPGHGGPICFDAVGALYEGLWGMVAKLPPGASDFITVAGNGKPGFAGDNGPATNAQIGASGGIAADSQGNLWIADTSNGRIRKVTPDGVIAAATGVAA